MSQLLLSTAFVLSPLFPSNTPAEKRAEILSQYFSPKPGQEMATISNETRRNHKGDHLNTKGYIWVRPPKGHCFIITREQTEMDKTICEPKRIDFQLKHLTHSGKFSWNVIQAHDDVGTKLTWQTPYRIANYIPLGRFDAGENIRLPILSCKASFDGITRKVVLTFFDDRKWYIPFPDKDQMVQGKKKERNLFVRVMTTNKDGEAEAEDASTGDNVITEEDVKRRHKILSMKLSGKYKEKEKVQYTFLLSPYEAFEMNSAHVMEVGGPVGLDGQCRYRFRDARFDPESGVVECFNTDNYDALYAHMTCSGELKERPLDPKPEDD